MKAYEMVRKSVIYESVRVEASSKEEAMNLAQDDDDSVEIMNENYGEYEVDYNSIYEIVEP